MKDMDDIIYALVYADEEFSARIAAREVVHKKIEHSVRGLAYVSYVDEEGCRQIASDQEVQFPPALQVSTTLFPTEDNRGLELVNSVIEENRISFKESIDHICYFVVNYSDEELFSASDESKGSANPSLFRMWCSTASGNQGGDARLYDFNGDAIQNPTHLQPLLDPSWSSMLFFDEGDDPYWGEHVWTRPLWAVPFLRITEVSI
jgi:hypothetical protein